MKVYYWKGIFGDESVIAQYGNVIQKLLNGEYQSADLEKLKGYQVFSARLTDTDRMLLVQTTVHGVQYLLIVEVILNHRYDKSKALNNPAFLKAYKEAQTVALTAEINAGHFENAHANPLLVEPTQTPIEYVKSYWQQEKFIILSNVQGEASKVALPALVEGGPGTGKSTEGLVILEERISQMEDLSDKPMLYLTESTELLDNMSDTWANMGLYNQKVEFKTWEMLIQTIHPEINDLAKVGKKYFIAWLKAYIAKYKRNSKASAQQMQGFFLKLDEIYLECRIIKGFINNSEAYNQLGQMQSIFTNKDEKKWLFKACTDYINELKANKKYDADFYTITPEPYYQFIVVDESQDLSINQLIQLSQLVDNKQIVYLMDTKQTIDYNPHIRSLLIDCIPIDKNSCKKLDKNFRNAKLVVDLLNAVVEVIFTISEGKVYKEEYTKVECASDTGLGEVLWIDEIDKKMQEKLIKAAKNKGFAVIIPDYENADITKAVKNKIIDLIDVAQVYTISKSKGLEFDTVLLFDIFENPRYKEVAHILKNKPILSNLENVHLTKDKKPKNKSLCTDMYLAFVAISRGRQNTILFSPPSPELAPLTSRLQEATTLLSKGTSSQWEHIEATSNAGWLERVKELILAEQDETALRILTMHLQKSSQDFALIYQKTWQEKISALVSDNAKEKALTLYVTKLNGKKEEFLRLYYGEEIKAETPKPKPQEKKTQNTNTFFRPEPTKQPKKNKKAKRRAAAEILNTTTTVSIKPETTVTQKKVTPAPQVVYNNDLIRKNYETHQKHLGFVNRVIAKFDKDTLKIIFEHHNLNIWLFDTVSKDGCLFTRIFSNLEHFRTFSQFLSSNPTFIKNIDSKKLWELLNINMNKSDRLPILIKLILRDNEFLDFFVLLLKEHPDFVNDLDVELFTTPLPLILTVDMLIHNIDRLPDEWKAKFALYTISCTYSPMFLLTNTQKGVLACRNFKLWDKVPDEAFFRKAHFQQDNTILDLGTPFCNILKSTHGVLIWQELITSRNSLATKMTGADLSLLPYAIHVDEDMNTEIVSKKVPMHANVPLYKLIVQDSAQFFDLLNTLNPTLMQGIPLDTMLWSPEVGHPCALHYLSNYNGAFYLQQWIDFNPKEFEEVPESAFFLRADKKEYEKCWNATPVMHLMMGTERLPILLKIIKLKPGLLQLFTKNSLCEPYLKASVAVLYSEILGDVPNPLFTLTITNIGIQLLSQIFGANPSLVSEIGEDIWCEKYICCSDEYYKKYDPSSQNPPLSAVLNLMLDETPQAKKVLQLLPSNVKREGTQLKIQYIQHTQKENENYLSSSPF